VWGPVTIPQFSRQSYVSIVLVASIVTLATEWLATTVFFSPGGFISQGYGFPFAWKEVDASCPPPCLQANGTFYDWFSFGGDLLFFIPISYAVLYYLLPKSQALRKLLESRKLFAILTLIVVALGAANYAYD
jgi:hypothetical protein